MKVISHKQLPYSLPVSKTVVFWLFLDRISPPPWVCGALWAVVAFLWVVAIYGMCI